MRRRRRLGRRCNIARQNETIKKNTEIERRGK